MCPRCRAVVTARKKNPYSRSMALLLAAGLMYLPANIYPIATIPIGLTPTSYTVLGGVIDLVRSHLLGLAALVFTANILGKCSGCAAQHSRLRSSSGD